MIEASRQANLLDKVSRLTRREQEVLALIGRGLTLPQIADRLKRSQKTIESHRLALGRKLEAANRVALARIAITAGLAPLDTAPSSAAEARNQSLRMEIASHGKAWAALQKIEAVINEVTGRTYLRQLVYQLGAALGGCGALVGVPGSDRQSILYTFADLSRGEVYEAQPHPVQNVPFDDIQDNDGLWMDGDAQQRYPQAPLLRQMNARGCLGVPLQRGGEKLGVLAVLYHQRIDRSCEPESILRICAARAATELERLAAEQQAAELSEQLEEQVVQRTHDLHQANSELQKRVAELVRTQDQLCKSEHQYRTLVEAVSEGICVIDPRGRISYANRPFCEILGRSPDELIGRDPADFFADRRAAEWFRAQDDDRRRSRLGRYTISVRRPDGQIAGILVSPRAMYDDQGRYLGSVGVVTSLEGRVRAVEADRPAAPADE